MIRPEITILIPCHSLEDFPTDLGESEASGLLNAFSAAYHPVLLAAARELPNWKRADEPPAVTDDAVGLTGKIIIVPACCASWLPHHWSEEATASGAVVLENIEERDELVSQLLSALLTIETAQNETAESSTPPDTEQKAEPAEDSDGADSRQADRTRQEIDAELAADFLAFGTAMLQLELLTRRMHYYSNLDSSPVRLDVVAAAEAAVAGDCEQARRRLSRAFELLLDARERYFPVDSYLIDLCLVVPQLADKLPETLSSLAPTTLLATASDWDQIATEHPELVERLAADWHKQHLCLVGGEMREGPTSLLPVESVLWELNRGRAVFQRLFGRPPTIWARRRYGFSTLLPQLLERSQMPYAVHAALDDGYYPDDELSRFRWEGCDGVSVDAFSRIPLAADSATSFLRLSQRLAESMEQDQTAAAMFARWPEVSSPWLDDLRRIHRYAPVFGRIVGLETFFEDSELPGRTHRHRASDYFAPYLTQAVARRLPDPIGRFGHAVTRRHQLDAVNWLQSIVGVLQSEYDASTVARREDDSEEAGPDAEMETALEVDRQLVEATSAAAGSLASMIAQGSPHDRGVLIVNPLSFSRRVVVQLPEGFSPPVLEGPVKQIQFDSSRHNVVVELPGSGFAWLPGDSSTDAPRDRSITAEELTLRNEFFELRLSETTGGIAFLKGHGRSPKRLSQQLAYRFPRKRQIESGDGNIESTYYGIMRARSVELTCDGPALAKAVTAGELIDQISGDVMATFRQTIRVWRERPVVELDVVLDPQRLPEGDPWTNYYACRFAWNDPDAVLTRSVQQTAQPTPDGRFDAPHYLEIAEGDLRTTIVPLELPFHRRTGERMLDTLLIVDGESTRSFRFVIACDDPYPMRPALDAYVPPIVVETSGGPPPAGRTGWFFQVDARNVQVTSVRPLPPDDGGPGGLQVRLLETEGRARRARLACFKSPTSARLVTLAGETAGDLLVEAGTVSVDLGAYEVATLELRF